MLTLGTIDYLNFIPMWGEVLLHHVELPFIWTQASPSKLNTLMLQNKLDISFISSIEFLKHQQKYHLLPYCIAANHEVLSVNLYLKGSIEDLDEKKIGLTTDSATSITLLEVLCYYFWKVTPQWESLDSIANCQQYDAFLMIGDQALLNPTFAGYHTIDLAKAWHTFTGLPFCFAVCAVQKTIQEQHFQKVREVEQYLERSLRWGKSHMKELIDCAIQKHAVLKNQTDLIQTYFSLLQYRFEEPQKQGLQKFWSLAKQII